MTSVTCFCFLFFGPIQSFQPAFLNRRVYHLQAEEASFESVQHRKGSHNTPQGSNGKRLFATVSLPQYPVLERLDKAKSLIRDTNFAKVYMNSTVLDAVQTMNLQNRGSVLVVDENDELMGIFTERDFVSKVLDEQKQSSEVLIKTVMTPYSNLVTANGEYTLSDCRKIMVEKNIRHLPIMDGSTKTPIGVISMREIIRSLQQEDLAREKLKFSGNSLKQIEEQAKARANELALLEGGNQDYWRAGFVVLAASLGAALLQVKFS